MDAGSEVRKGWHVRWITMCVAMAESAPISLETISCTMLTSGPSSSRILAAMWAKTDSGKRTIVSLLSRMKSSSCHVADSARLEGGVGL